MAANQTVTVYGNTSMPFIEKVPTERRNYVFGLGFPLGKNKSTGGFFQKKTGVSLIQDAVKQLLLTERGERVMLPKYGFNLRGYLFQPLDESMFESIKEEIQFSFNNYIVGASILKLAVIPFGGLGPAGGNSLLVKLTLQLDEEDLSVFDVEVNIS